MHVYTYKYIHKLSSNIKQAILDKHSIKKKIQYYVYKEWKRITQCHINASLTRKNEIVTRNPDARERNERKKTENKTPKNLLSRLLLLSPRNWALQAWVLHRDWTRGWSPAPTRWGWRRGATGETRGRGSRHRRWWGFPWRGGAHLDNEREAQGQYEAEAKRNQRVLNTVS